MTKKNVKKTSGPKIFKSVIEDLAGSWGSGIATLKLRDCRTGEVKNVPADNGPLVRALAGAYGREVISAGHSVDSRPFIGKTIYWGYDEFGLCLGGFIPEENAPEKTIEYYENQ